MLAIVRSCLTDKLRSGTAPQCTGSSACSTVRFVASIPKVATFDATVNELFGSRGDSMADIEARAARLFPDHEVVVWEGDAATFQFTYVGTAAERVLGYPARRWVNEATFWADHVVLALDRDEAIGYCALATFRGRDHAFEYRACAADGRTLWIRDFVRVIDDGPAHGKRLRGVMFDVTAEKQTETTSRELLGAQAPTRAELEQ